MSKQEALYVLEAIERYWKDHSGDLQGPAHADRREALGKAHVELTRIARAPVPVPPRPSEPEPEPVPEPEPAPEQS